MELNKRYLQSEFPIENLSAGTIIEAFYTEQYKNEDGTLILITEAEGIWSPSEDLICGVSIKDGEYFTSGGHSVIEYEIKRL